MTEKMRRSYKERLLRYIQRYDENRSWKVTGVVLGLIMYRDPAELTIPTYVFRGTGENYME